MKSVQTPTVRFELHDDGIVHSYPNVTSVAPQSSDVVRDAAALDGLLDGGQHPMVWRVAGIIPPDGATWTTLIRYLPKGLTALAIVPSDPELLGRFPKAIGALILPVRVFPDDVAATEWAAQFVDSQDHHRD